MLFIRKVGTELYLHSDIDPGGMSVCWMRKEYADQYDSKELAEAMVDRCVERYPNEKFEIVQ
jgi:hypothetical protein